MKNTTALIEFLKEHFPSDKVINKGGIYKNVILESSIFTFGDYDCKKLMDALSVSGYSGFFFTPRNENGSDARHKITFHA